MRVRLDYGPVYTRCQAEVVRIDNQTPHEASLAGRQGRIENPAPTTHSYSTAPFQACMMCDLPKETLQSQTDQLLQSISSWVYKWRHRSDDGYQVKV